MPEAAPAVRASGSRRWRPRLRALHRDVGYFGVGLTVVYAVSGLAVNHIQDWDPNFTQIRREHRLPIPIATTDSEAARQVLAQLDMTETPREVFRASASQLDIVLDHSTLHVDTTTGVVQEEGQKPRGLLRLANWLHLNRGKKAWTYVADGYAICLLFLAGSGLLMIPGRKGFWGRGGVIFLLGALVPVVYVTLSGGP